MTLGRLVLAWLPVALWFAGAGWAARRCLGPGAGPDPTRRWLVSTTIEAVFVTLFASLWFDSLGHGEWWMLFILVGLLAAAPARGAGVTLVLVTVTRYVGAGALLSWRLQ